MKRRFSGTFSALTLLPPEGQQNKMDVLPSQVKTNLSKALKAVDAFTSQLEDKDKLIHSLRSQLEEKEKHISELNQAIASLRGKPSTPPSPATVPSGQSKSTPEKKRKQQPQTPGLAATTSRTA